MLLAVLLPGWAGAAAPSATPILRIESGTHLSRITSISTDAQGRWLATASFDMTVRIWDLASGELLGVLRPPVDAGDASEQALDAVSMSPDGGLVAVGGRVGHGWQPADATQVFLFERTSGRMIRRIEIPLANRQWWSAVSALKFSPDGRTLAVGLQHEGVRLYDTEHGREIGRDARFAAIDALDFSPDGRKLAAAAPDGDHSALLLYDVDAGLRPRAAADSRNVMLPAHLSDVRYSPDGHWLAVAGSAVGDAVEVLDGENLRLAWLPVATGIGRGAAQLDLLAWSADGRLIGTGNWRVNGENQARVWSQSGRNFTDLAIGDRRLFDLAALPDGRMAFATVEPAWGIIGADGRSIPRRTAAMTVDFSAGNQPGRLDVTPDGHRVQFRFRREDTDPTIFDLDGGYATGRDSSPLQPVPPGLAFDLHDPDHILLNGRPLAIPAFGTGPAGPACLYVAHDGKHFALCTRGYLVYYSDSGRELWRQAAPGGTANLAAISADGRWVVGAFSDGTIRWFRSSDGAETLALFAHADRKRWVLWTPSGFYSASAGGEDLVGWHVNRGKSAAADFYPLSRCRSWFLRPDVIARVLDAGDESRALHAANAAAGRPADAAPASLPSILPPAVTIESSEPIAAARIKLRLALRSPADAPVTAIRARVNGLPVAIDEVHDAGTVPGLSEAQITVPLPPADAVIQVFAENRNAVSMPALLQVLAPAVHDGGDAPVKLKAKLYVLAVGVSRYDNPEYRLEFAAKDAADFAATMRKQKGALYRDVEVRLLTDADARRDAVVQGLEWLRHSVTVTDIGILLLAGHGLNDRLGGYYYAPANIDLNALDQTGVQFSDIKQALANVAGRAVFFVDTCHAGNALGGRRANVNPVINELTSAENGVAVLSASTGRQEAQESADWGHGAFTKAILEGVTGGADYQKPGRITLKMMDLYLSLRVKELTAGQQTPVIIAPFGLADFEIASD